MSATSTLATIKLKCLVFSLRYNEAQGHRLELVAIRHLAPALTGECTVGQGSLSLRASGYVREDVVDGFWWERHVG